MSRGEVLSPTVTRSGGHQQMRPYLIEQRREILKPKVSIKSPQTVTPKIVDG